MLCACACTVLVAAGCGLLALLRHVWGPTRCAIKGANQMTNPQPISLGLAHQPSPSAIGIAIGIRDPICTLWPRLGLGPRPSPRTPMSLRGGMVPPRARFFSPSKVK
eukprot:773326-Prymnesium_polylepis.1